MQPLIRSDIDATHANRHPGYGPVGSVYQPTAYFPTNQNVNVVAQGGIPPASKYGAVSFPVSVWNAKYNGGGNPLAIYAQTGAR